MNEYVIQGYYGRWEDLTYEETKKEAIAMKKCYDENEKIPHRIIKRRIKK